MLMKKGKITIVQDDEEPQVNAQQKSKKIFKAQKQPNKNQHKRLTQPLDNNFVPQEGAQQAAEQSVHSKIAHLAICFPDSILQIPQTSALRAYFISQIARITSIFKVDQIVILKDQGYTPKSEKFIPCQYIARNLQYLQTPQYLRKYLFKMHPDLNNVGLMNPVEARHHLKADEKSQFREGVALQRPTKTGAGSWVDIGLKHQARMDHLILPLTRVTLRIKNFEEQDANIYEAEAVSKSAPRLQKGIYWGYDVRIAHNLKEMTSDYDVVILCNHSAESYELREVSEIQSLQLAQKRVLIYFSGTDDLDELIKRDPRPKWSLEEALKRIDCAIKLAVTGVKQLRLEERMFLTLSKFASWTL